MRKATDKPILMAVCHPRDTVHDRFDNQVDYGVGSYAIGGSWQDRTGCSCADIHPWFRVADESALAQITVKHPLTQTSGFSNSAGLLELAASDTSEQAIENSVRALKDVRLVRAPGTAYEYSERHLHRLGLVVQMVSGQTLRKLCAVEYFLIRWRCASFTSRVKRCGMECLLLCNPPLGFPSPRMSHSTVQHRGRLPDLQCGGPGALPDRPT